MPKYYTLYLYAYVSGLRGVPTTNQQIDASLPTKEEMTDPVGTAVLALGESDGRHGCVPNGSTYHVRRPRTPQEYEAAIRPWLDYQAKNKE